jgi:thiol-disulfide isomerase/thioredoxin
MGPVKRNLLILFFFLALSGTAQVLVRIKGEQGNMMYLTSFTINGYQKLDSTKMIGNQFMFPVTAKTPPGIYRIGNGKSDFEFILNEPSLQFETVGNALQDSLRVISSAENVLFEIYRKMRDKAYMQLDLLNQVLAYYDPLTGYYKTTLDEFTSNQDRFFDWTDSVITSHPESFIAHYIKADIKPRIQPGLNVGQQKLFFQEHWFDEVDWMDNTMMASDVLTKKITSYLGLYSNPGLRKPELSQAFIAAVDKILPLARQNPVIYDFTLKYLIHGFERYGFDDVIMHIATDFSTPQQCENERQSETLARLEKYKLLAIGKTAPEIIMNDMNGNQLILSSIRSRKLLIFWASWCPHCQQLIPQMISWSQQGPNKDIRLIPISLDDDKSALEKAIIDLKIPWPVFTDYKKWNSKAAIDYNIYATPTMLLLDKDNKIIGKPMDLGELNRTVEE